MPTVMAPTSSAVERLPGYLDAVLYLSQQIGRARVELAGMVFIQHILMQLFEWTIIATGLFTTVLISVKSLASPKSRGFLTMAVAAVVLSSFGTAVATLNSFYTPRVAYEGNRQSLGMLRNLHRSLAGAALRQNDACNDKGDWAKDWRLRQLRTFNGNFQMIMSTDVERGKWRGRRSGTGRFRHQPGEQPATSNEATVYPGNALIRCRN